MGSRSSSRSPGAYLAVRLLLLDGLRPVVLDPRALAAGLAPQPSAACHPSSFMIHGREPKRPVGDWLRASPRVARSCLSVLATAAEAAVLDVPGLRWRR